MKAQHTLLALLALATTPGLTHPNGHHSLSRSAKGDKRNRKILLNEQDEYVYDDELDLAAEDLDDQPFDADNLSNLHDTRLSQPMPEHTNESETNHTQGSEDEDYASARAIAKLIIMDRLLSALGFGESLPTPPNGTLATVPTPINITSEHCPYKYKRCTSQTFFPSCDHPRNTDPEVWTQHFNLFFNLSDDFDSTLDVINATLRLFKNSSLPLEYPTTLLIKVSMYTKSLNRRRAKTTLVADAQVPSDYIGWVSLPVDKMVRKWKKSKNNHGLLVTVSDVIQMTWDAPKLFVIMDCTSGLVPLPFEIQTDLEGQRYPALNVRHGSLDDDFPGTTEPSTQESWIMNMNINPELLNEASNLKLPIDLSHPSELNRSVMISDDPNLEFAHIHTMANHNSRIHGNNRNRVSQYVGETDSYLESEDLQLGNSPHERHHLNVNHVNSETSEPKSIDSREFTSSEDIQVPRKQRAETRRGRRRNQHSQRRRSDSRATSKK